MKISNKFLMLAVTGLFLVACKNQNNPETEENQSTDQTKEISAVNLQEASFLIDGMQCEYGCAKGIEKKLAKLEGIKSAKVDFDSKEATVEYDATLQTPQTITQTVEAMSDSYKVSKIKSSSDQSSLYFDKGKPKKEAKAKNENTKVEKSDTKVEKTATSDKSEEKKSCCSGKKSCGTKQKTV